MHGKELRVELRREGSASGGCCRVSLASYKKPVRVTGEKPNGSAMDFLNGRISLPYVFARQSKAVGLRRSVQLVHVLPNG